QRHGPLPEPPVPDGRFGRNSEKLKYTKKAPKTGLYFTECRSDCHTGGSGSSGGVPFTLQLMLQLITCGLLELSVGRILERLACTLLVLQTLVGNPKLEMEMGHLSNPAARQFQCPVGGSDCLVMVPEVVIDLCHAVVHIGVVRNILLGALQKVERPAHAVGILLQNSVIEKLLSAPGSGAVGILRITGCLSHFGCPIKPSHHLFQIPAGLLDRKG